jgi:hypothetical protein
MRNCIGNELEVSPQVSYSSCMNQLADKINAIAKRLSPDRLEELVGFAEALELSRSIPTPDAGYIIVELTFLSKEDGGREHPPMPPWGRDGQWYMPHVVVDGQTEYLGVRFLVCPEVIAGQPGRFILALMYIEVDYSSLVPGAQITLREGGRIIGKGTVIQLTH